jgi:hypothetical protein
MIQDNTQQLLKQYLVKYSNTNGYLETELPELYTNVDRSMACKFAKF